MGLPQEHLPRFMDWESSILHSRGLTPEEITDNRMTAMAAVSAYFRTVIAERCLGSHLARHELVIALEEWHKRIPDYRLADDAAIFEVGRSSGPDSVPLRWDR